MKIAKALGAVVVCLLALWGFGWFFVSQLGGSRSAGPAGVILTAPPGFDLVDRGELSPAGAADALLGLVQARPVGSKVGVHFRHAGAEVYWLAQTAEDTAADTLEERAAGASGTRTQTIWHGHLVERLQRARAAGDPALPGLPDPERKNLYH
ncbi:MAG TPA: hypothetical protein VH988_11505 [Thermoanaerobaculia bacterium]|jgi:hypothetical protein|nr:hypothetical protein [Thermoanaerobaculia bacterium]